MTKWPLKFTITTQRGGYWDTDRLGNEMWVPGENVPVKIFAYRVVKSFEKAITGGYPYLISDLEVIAPPGTFENAQSTAILPDGSEWELDGEAEDENNNPYFSPGLVTYHLTKAGA